MNLSLLQMMSGAGMAGALNSQAIPGVKLPSVPEGNTAASVCNWGKCLDLILQSEFKDGVMLDDDACGLYKIEITDTESGKEIYFIEMSPAIRCVKREIAPDRKPDVSVTISSQDLSSVLEGSLAPLQAYLTGRISANGDVRKLMFFEWCPAFPENSHIFFFLAKKENLLFLVLLFLSVYFKKNFLLYR